MIAANPQKMESPVIDTEPQNWEVELCRISYGFKTVTIKGATSRQEGEARALADAGDHEYQEKASDYSVNNSGVASN
jgi:hypothetical protein